MIGPELLLRRITYGTVTLQVDLPQGLVRVKCFSEREGSGVPDVVLPEEELLQVWDGALCTGGSQGNDPCRK